ncbi:MAG: DUF5939 domain-containing protein [Spirochaetia bacterium]|nr:DUF5939 domain-containing protein [Spirochaetia bacterium]
MNLKDETQFEKVIKDLNSIKKWKPGLTETLEKYIREGSDFELLYINTKKFSADYNFPHRDVLDLFLHAAKLGIFKIEWNLRCPQCGDRVLSFSSLQTAKAACFCQLESQASLDDLVTVNFTVDPRIRKIKFHDPDSLTDEEYLFYYRFSRDCRLPGIDAPFPDVVRSLSKYFGYLEPQEEKTVHFEYSGSYLVGSEMFGGAGFYKQNKEIGMRI